MLTQTLQLDLPAALYEQVQQRAVKTNRTVEDELIAAVEAFLAADEDVATLPDEIAEEIEQLSFLDDAHLWQAAGQVAAVDKEMRVQELVIKQQAEGLTELEQQEAQQLQQYAHRLMLIRAEAAVLLKQRGHNIATLRQTFNAAQTADPASSLSQ